MRLNSDSVCYSPDYANGCRLRPIADSTPYDGMPYGGTIGIGPYTALILSQDVG